MRRVLVVVPVVSLVFLAGACSSQSGTATGTATTQSVGVHATNAAATSSTSKYLVDTSGRAIYMFTADKPGESKCNDTCAVYWPPVPAPATVPSHIAGLTARFGSLTRSDGTRQLTIDGLPVYTYAPDSTNAVPTGQGVDASGGYWYVLSASGTPVMGAVKPATSSSTGSTTGRSY